MILARDGQESVSVLDDNTIHSGHAVQDIVMAPDSEHYYVLTDTKVDGSCCLLLVLYNNYHLDFMCVFVYSQ